MTSNSARLADKQGNIQEAINLYEVLIAQDSANFIDYVNLICIYFNCLDIGYASAHKVDSYIEKNCSTRALELIDEAERKFGKKDELIFWKEFIPFLGWGDEVGEWDLRGDSLVPYIYLTMENRTEKNIQKARKLYEELEGIEGSERKLLFMSRLEMLFGDLR